MMDNKKRILVVTHQFTPHVSPRTTRWSILCDQLIDRGYQVTVLTGTKQDEQKKFNVLYFGSQKIGNFIDNTRRASNNSEKSNITKKLFFSLLKKVYRFFFRTFAWPDYSMFWLFSINRHRKNIPEYDLLISVSLPFTSHVAAYLINKKKGKKWIMDIGDPFYLKKAAPENNNYIYSYLNKYIENKFYRTANSVMFTHRESMQHHNNSFPVLISKAIVLPPVFEAINKVPCEKFDFDKRPLKVAYFGVLTQGVRDPSQFLIYINKLNLDMELHWYVNEDTKQMVRNSSNKNIKNIFHNLVAREEALSLMIEQYHALISIGNKNPFQLPSKIVEYISTGKPIIHFSEIENDPVEEVLNKRSNAIILCENSDLERTKNEIKEKLFIQIDMTSVSSYSSKSVADKLEQII